MLASILSGLLLCGMTTAALAAFSGTADAIGIDPIPPTSVTNQTINGSCEPGAIVTVQCPGATVGEVSFPTENRWLVRITGLSEGTNQVTAVSDIGSPTTVTSDIVVDTAVPALVVSTLADGASTGNPTLNVSGFASDATGSGVAEVAVNGHSVPLAADGSFSYALSLLPGANSITAIARDVAGNSVRDARIVTFDPSTPRIEIGSPADNLATSQSPVTVTGLVAENTQIGLSVNGGMVHPVTVSGSGFSADAWLVPGLNTVAIVATKQGASSSEAKRTIVYDPTGATLQIQDPPEDLVTKQSGYTIKGAVSDSQGAVTVTAEGMETALTPVDGIFEHVVDFSENKTYRITARATDTRGNVAAVTRNIIYDNIEPAITGASSMTPPGHYGAGSSINISLSFSEPVYSPGLSISLSSQATIATGPLSGASSFSGTYVVSEDQNTPLLRVTSVAGTLVDAAGNQNTVPSVRDGSNIADLVAIAVDTAAPVATIGDHPADPVNASMGSIFFSFDEPGTSQCRLDSGSYGSCSSPFVFKDLADGRHTFSVRATDTAGNQGPAQSYSWTIDTKVPRVEAGPDQVRNTVFTHTATASDATALTYQWSKQSGPGAITFGSPTALVTTISASADGSYLLRLTATDGAGNSSSGDLTLTWDTSAPTVSAGGNKTAKTAFTQTGTASDATALTYQWTQQSGPGNIAFDSPTALATNVAASVDGTYQLRLTATDAAGNSAFSDMTLTWDTTAPLVSAGGDRSANATFTQTGSASDATALTYQWSKQSGPGAITFGSPAARVTTIQANIDGSYLLRLTVTDAAGNSSFSDMKLTWDTVSPFISAGASAAHNGTYTQVASVSDPQVVSVSWSLSSGPGSVSFGTPRSVVVGPRASAATTVTADREGIYLLWATGTDAAGNTSSDEATLIWDHTAPVLAITTLPDGSYTQHAVLPISGKVSDALSGIQRFNINGADIPLDGTGGFNYDLTLSDGPNVITSSTTDFAGNVAYEVRTIFLDQAPPELTIATPGDGLKANLPRVTVTGAVNKPCSITIKVSDASRVRSFQVEAPDGTYGMPIDELSPGLNTIEVTASSMAGLQTVKSITVTFDAQKPLLDVSSPTGTVRAVEHSITISGTASDPQSGVSVKITTGDETFTPELVNGRFSQTVTLNKEKVYTISVLATDGAGNQSVVERRVINGKLTGEIDGNAGVTLNDALIALKLSVGKIPQDDEYLLHGDIGPLKNGVPAPDGKIDIGDAVLILRLIVSSLILPK